MPGQPVSGSIREQHYRTISAASFEAPLVPAAVTAFTRT
jgi:hypothetical protein